MFIAYELCNRFIQATIAATYMLCLQCFISFIKNHFQESPGRALIEHKKIHLH